MSSEIGWFSDIDENAEGEFKWQPCLDTGSGHIPSMQVWFKTKEDSDNWIKMYILDRPLLA